MPGLLTWPLMPKRRVPPLRSSRPLGVGWASHADDVRHGGNGLGVVDDGGSAVEADDSGEGRLDAGNAALAFEGLHEGGFFADFVGSGAGLGDDLKLRLAAEDILAQEAFCMGICDGLLPTDLKQVAVLAAQVDEAHLGADSEAGDDGAFNDRVRVVQEDQVILAGAGLGLVAVDQDVFGLGRLLGDERPFQAGWKARAAASAQAAFLHLVDDPLRALGEGFAWCGLIAAEFDVAVDHGRAHAEAAGDDLYFVGMGDEPRHGHRLLLLCSWPALRLPYRW